MRIIFRIKPRDAFVNESGAQLASALHFDCVFTLAILGKQPEFAPISADPPSRRPAPVPKTSDDSAAPQGATEAPAPSVWELFTTFLSIGLMGFGGLAPAAHHMLVEKKKWYGPKDYVELFALCSILPGGNILNASIVIGHRFQGAVGAFVCISALMATPLVLLIILATTYDSFSHIPDVRAATAGAASAAAGLIVGTAGKLIRGVEKSWTSLAVGAAVFLAIGVLRQPLQVTLLVLLPVVIGWGFFRARRQARRRDPAQ